MTPRKILLLAGFVIPVLGAAWLWWSPAFPGTAPDAAFRFIDGRQVALQDLRGQPVLVTFWATTCRICLGEMPELIALHRELSGWGFEIIAVAMAYDPPDRVIHVVNERGLPYPVALDIDGKIAGAFGGVSATPASFLIAPDGSIVKQKTGETDMTALRRQIMEYITQPVEVES